jgi:hypothetical protein
VAVNVRLIPATSMRRSTKAELRMLREIGWHFGTIKKCYFCKKPLLESSTPGATDLKFGERSFPPIKTKLAIHHQNEDHNDNRPKNRKPAHSKCHRKYHIKIQHAKAKGKRIGSKFNSEKEIYVER